ncbi:MAG: anti-sigma factor family protein [Thermoanaerobaculia bacterium]
MSEDDEKPPLDAALRHLAEQQRRSLTSHPTPQELAAYHAGELPSEAEARILDHLAVCRECSDLLLDLSGFADLKPPAGVPDLTDEQVEEDWQALRARMRKEAPLPSPPRTAEVVPIRPAGPSAKPERTYPVWLPVAASLLAVLGFSFGLYQGAQVGALKRELEEQRQAWSAPVISLVHSVQRSGEDDTAATMQSMSSREGAILSFYDEDIDLYPAYEARIDEGTPVKATVSVEDRAVFVVIEREQLKPGLHRIEFYGVNGEKRSEARKFEIQVNDP